MKKLTLLFFIICVNLNAEVVSGKIDFIQMPTNQKLVYFKLKETPANVTSGYFYITPFSGDIYGCNSNATEETMQRAYSALLMAHASSKEIELYYCTGDGYGIVNGYIRVK